jgi:hypothetical protein
MPRQGCRLLVSRVLVCVFCMVIYDVLTCFSGAGIEIEQLVVALVRLPADKGASTKSGDVTSPDPWAHFCVVADGGGEITGGEFCFDLVL